jgi:MarR family transcriptional regulator, organic hydroperoxide resistance regulator
MPAGRSFFGIESAPYFISSPKYADSLYTIFLLFGKYGCILQLMMDNAERYSLEDSLAHLCARFYRAMWKQVNKELSEAGLEMTVEQWPILIHLWDRNGQTQKELARRLFKDKTTMARLVAGAESAGMVQREPGQQDRREKMVFLTEKGRQIMDKATMLITRVDAMAVSQIDPQELTICKEVLRRVHRNLSD